MRCEDNIGILNWKDKGYIPFAEGDEFRLYDPDVDCIPEKYRCVK